MAPDQLLLQHFSRWASPAAAALRTAPGGHKVLVPPILGDIPRPCGVQGWMFSPLPTAPQEAEAGCSPWASCRAARRRGPCQGQGVSAVRG